MATPEEILTRALAAVEGADTPSDLREAAFARVFDLLAGEEPGEQLAGEEPGEDQRPLPEAEPSREGPSSWKSQIASSFGIAVEEVEETFEYSDNALEVILPTGAVSETTKEGLKELAHLVSAGRQAMGLEDATSTKVIRPIAQHYDKSDSHFARNIDELDDLFIIKSLNARDKSLKARRKAFEEAGPRQDDA